MSGTEPGNPVAGGAVPLFAIPFSAVNTGADQDFNARLAALCASHPGGRHELLDSADATAVEARRLILGHATAVVASLNSTSLEEFGKLQIAARGWCSVVPRDGHLPAQHFPGAAWLAAYCAQAGESDAGATGAGVLRLYERRLGSIYRDASTAALKPPYRYGNHSWTPAPGRMALFPAHVPHEVSVVRSDTPLVLVFALIRYE